MEAAGRNTRALRHPAGRARPGALAPAIFVW